MSKQEGHGLILFQQEQQGILERNKRAIGDVRWAERGEAPVEPKRFQRPRDCPLHCLQRCIGLGLTIPQSTLYAKVQKSAWGWKFDACPIF
jgi:hypothetical protein